MEKDLTNVEEEAVDEKAKARREFLKKAGKFSISAPMAALLLSVDSKRATALSCGYGGTGACMSSIGGTYLDGPEDPFAT